MIERLQRALEHIEELSPEAQEDLAVQIEEMTEPIGEIPQSDQQPPDENLPKSVRDALAVFGAARDVQHDDEFEALDRMRHEVPTTPTNEESLPKSVRDALAVIGAWRDLQDDDEFEALDRIRHESTPTPPIELDDL